MFFEKLQINTVGKFEFLLDKNQLNFALISNSTHPLMSPEEKLVIKGSSDLNVLHLSAFSTLIHTLAPFENQIKKPSSLRPWNGPAIILMDLDAFFASVEQLDHPEWKGKPVIVGGSPEKRGVVSTASYEARTYGVHSAMPSSTAARLCPNAIWTPGNFHRYREMSKQVMNILLDESPQLMQVSIDEAFLDVSPTRTNKERPRFRGAFFLIWYRNSMRTTAEHRIFYGEQRKRLLIGERHKSACLCVLSFIYLARRFANAERAFA